MILCALVKLPEYVLSRIWIPFLVYTSCGLRIRNNLSWIHSVKEKPFVYADVVDCKAHFHIPSSISEIVIGARIVSFRAVRSQSTRFSGLSLDPHVR